MIKTERVARKVGDSWILGQSGLTDRPAEEG